jgi:hypothetical protein
MISSVEDLSALQCSLYGNSRLGSGCGDTKDQAIENTYIYDEAAASSHTELEDEDELVKTTYTRVLHGCHSGKEVVSYPDLNVGLMRMKLAPRQTQNGRSGSRQEKKIGKPKRTTTKMTATAQRRHGDEARG